MPAMENGQGSVVAWWRVWANWLCVCSPITDEIGEGAEPVIETPPIIDEPASADDDDKSYKGEDVLTGLFNERYRMIDKQIGAGSFSEVFLVQRLRDRRLYAGKCNIAKRFGSEHKLRREFYLVKSLCHPNIINVRDFMHYADNIFVLVMDYFGAGTLAQRLSSVGHFNEVVAKIYVNQILLALFYLHKNFIVHGDVKPSNVICCYPLDCAHGLECTDELCQFRKHTVKLIDFGMAEEVPRDNGVIQKRAGTGLYIAPEVLCVRRLNVKSDIWSLGITAYQLLTGFVPFVGRTRVHTMIKMWKKDISYLYVEEMEKITFNGKDFIRQCLQENPYMRMSSTNAMRHPWLKTKESRLDPSPRRQARPPKLIAEMRRRYKRSRDFCYHKAIGLYDRVEQECIKHRRNNSRNKIGESQNTMAPDPSTKEPIQGSSNYTIEIDPEKVFAKCKVAKHILNSNTSLNYTFNEADSEEMINNLISKVEQSKNPVPPDTYSNEEEEDEKAITFMEPPEVVVDLQNKRAETTFTSDVVKVDEPIAGPSKEPQRRRKQLPSLIPMGCYYHGFSKPLPLIPGEARGIIGRRLAQHAPTQSIEINSQIIRPNSVNVRPNRVTFRPNHFIVRPNTLAIRPNSTVRYVVPNRQSCKTNNRSKGLCNNGYDNPN